MIPLSSKSFAAVLARATSFEVSFCPSADGFPVCPSADGFPREMGQAWCALLSVDQDLAESTMADLFPEEQDAVRAAIEAVLT